MSRKEWPCGCYDEGNFSNICEACWRIDIEAKYDRFPMLRDWRPDATCCHGCRQSEAAEKFGWDAAAVFGELDFMDVVPR